MDGRAAMDGEVGLRSGPNAGGLTSHQGYDLEVASGPARDSVRTTIPTLETISCLRHAVRGYAELRGHLGHAKTAVITPSL